MLPNRTRINTLLAILALKIGYEIFPLEQGLLVLTVRKTGGNQHEFLNITQEDVFVNNYTTSESENGIIDQWGFNYGKILITYQEQKADGSLGDTTTVGWDLKINKPIQISQS